MPKTTTDNRPEFKPVNFGAAAIDIPSEHHGRSPRGRQSQWPDQTLGECRSSVRIRGREGHRFVGGGCCCQKRLCGRPWRTRQPYH
ncbi:hypothetical protein ACVWVY_007833 [Bradyrhizobium sp. URHC0002]